MAKKKVKWNEGDLFLVPQKDKNYSVGVILDLMMPNVVRCALFDERVSSTNIDPDEYAEKKNLISLIAISREQLDYGVWPIIGKSRFQLEKSKYPNEQYRNKGWVGAKTYDAALIEDFLDAFNKLTPWDDWYKPDYLDGFLISPAKKPSGLLYKKNRKRVDNPTDS